MFMTLCRAIWARRGCRRALGIALALACGARAHAASAQVVALAAGGPRFLYASSRTAKPVEVDVSRTELLRRRVSLHVRRAAVASLLAAIAEQTGIEFLYSPQSVPLSRIVGLRVDSITVAAALTEVLVDTGLDVLLSGGRQIVLVERRVLDAPKEPGAIMGRVTDTKSGQGLDGAEVRLGDTRWRTTADSTGRYRLAGVDTGSYTLLVRRFGYAKYSHRITVRGDRDDTVNVALEPLPLPLEDLVSTAAGQQRRRDLGNSITTIRADSVLQSAPIKSLTDLLQNRVPGLTVQHSSGAPGDPARLRLRGLRSAFRSNDPIVIVDGVRVYAAQSEARSGNLTNLTYYGGTAGGAPAPSPLDQIDPNIIDKVEVFKGASAATLYGADAANGVIVITTKRGKPGPTLWDASATVGRSVIPGRYPTGYYRWGHDQFREIRRFCTLVDLTCIQDSLVQFQALNDPALTIVGGHGTTATLSLTASGGTPALTYSVTGSYDSETGAMTLPAFEVDRFRKAFNRDVPDWMRRPHDYQRWSVRSNVKARLSASADVVLTAGLTRSNQQRTSLENQLTSLMGTYIDTVNGVYYRPDLLRIGVVQNTPAILEGYYTRTTASTITFTTGLSADWRPRSWFTATAQAGLDVVPRDDQLFRPAGLLTATDSGQIIRGTGQSLVSTANVQGMLRKPLRHGFAFETSVGANLNGTRTRDLASSATGLVPGTSSISGARTITATDGAVSTSVYGWWIEPRLTGQRISLSTGLRLDGGSAYGTRITGSNGRGFLGNLLSLPKLNGSWVVSEEPWFPFKQAFSSFRLRGAYGQAQVQPGPADRLRLYDQTVALTTLGNTELRPERSTEFEGGFDADLLDTRVSLEFSAYRSLQVDALMPVTLPSSINGGGTVLKNIGNIRNKGVEVTLGVTPVQAPGLRWSTQLHYTRYNNTLLKLGRGVDPSPTAGLVVGYPVGSRWEHPILGYADANGDGVLQKDEIQVGDSMVYMGRLLPAYTTSLFTNLALFGGTVGLTAGFSYDGGQTQINDPARVNWVLARALVDPSTPLSEQAAVLALPRAQSYTSVTTQYGIMQTVSTLRFSSLSVNYRAPEALARRLGARRLQVAVQGGNLAMHSSYHGKDPDVNAWKPGDGIADTGQLPLPRTWQLALYLGY